MLVEEAIEADAGAGAGIGLMTLAEAKRGLVAVDRPEI